MQEVLGGDYSRMKSSSGMGLRLSPLLIPLLEVLEPEEWETVLSVLDLGRRFSLLMFRGATGGRLDRTGEGTTGELRFESPKAVEILIFRLNHAEGAELVVFVGLAAVLAVVEILSLLFPLPLRFFLILRSMESSENLDIKLRALADGRRSMRGVYADQVGHESTSTGCTRGELEVGEKRGENGAGSDGRLCDGRGRWSAETRRIGAFRAEETSGDGRCFSAFT